MTLTDFAVAAIILVIFYQFMMSWDDRVGPMFLTLAAGVILALAFLAVRAW